MPGHVAIIMDGNGRWAKQQFRPRVWGHHRGVERVREVIEAASALGIEALTLFAFSEENWSRPADEVGTIMSLLNTYLRKEMDALHRKNVCLRVIGDLSRIPAPTRVMIEQALELMSANTGLKLTIALSYGAKTEITNACKVIAKKVQSGELDIEAIDHDIFAEHLHTHGLPALDLLIRTSGEQRVSNFLLWQLAYAELYFTPVYWPDFTRAHLEEAIRDYQNRQRRFGKVADDVEPSRLRAGGSSSSMAFHGSKCLSSES